MPFFLERWNGNTWTALACSPEMLTPASLDGPQQQMPGNASPGNLSAFTGLPGNKARIRYDDIVVEEFDWDRVPINEFDADTDYMWGWRSVSRHYESVPWDKAAINPHSFVG